MLRSDDRFCFLLGAGASFDAGYPLLHGLTREVESSLPRSLRPLYRQLLRADLPDFEAERRSVEDVLTSADSITASRLAFVPGISVRDAAFLAHEVRKAIWIRLSRKPNLHPELDRFVEIAKSPGSGPVFSLNNDLVIEASCERHAIPLDRGFGPDGIFALSTDRVPAGDSVRLVKLHGSLDWVYSVREGLRIARSRTGSPPSGVVREPRTPIPDLAVVFPSRIKTLALAPLRSLLTTFADALSGVETLVVVGCQLVDAHIVEAIAAGMIANANLTVLVVDPSPGDVLSRLSSVAGSASRRLLAHRVDALASTFSDALADDLEPAIERSKRGELSLAREIILFLDDLGAGAEDELEDSRTRVLERLKRPVSEREHVLLRKLLASYRALPAVGPVPETARKIERILTAGPDPELVSDRLARLVTEIVRYRSTDVIDLAQEGDVTWVTHRSGGRMGLAHLDEELRPVPITDVVWIPGKGLSTEGDALYFFERGLRGQRAMGWLRRTSIGSGATRRLPIRRPFRYWWDWMRETTGHLLARRREYGLRKGGRDLLVGIGAVAWPTAIRPHAPGQIVVVESRRASIVAGPGRRFPRVQCQTRGLFVNLRDAATLDPTRVLLVEGGIAGEGRLLLWSIAERSEDELLSTIHRITAIAIDRPGGQILVAAGRRYPEGVLLSIPIALVDSAARSVRVLLSGLPSIDTMVVAPHGRLRALTGFGLIEITLPTGGEGNEI